MTSQIRRNDMASGPRKALQYSRPGDVLSAADPDSSPIGLAVDFASDRPFPGVGRWKTADTYAKRRIFPIKDNGGNLVGYRAMIQQGRGVNRQTHSEVFRITPLVNVAMAMAMAQRWRDKKEAELGIHSGRVSSKSASRFVPGISLVVSSTGPLRASWKWSSPGRPTVTKYIGKKLGYASAYRALVHRICDILDCRVPQDLPVPTPNPVQYLRLQSGGISELPERRSKPR
jgi:hypothetical protein